MPSKIEQFAEAANQFCSWAEGDPRSPEDDALLALKHLTNILHLALQLPTDFGEEEPLETTQDDWDVVYKRFGALPFNYYSQCFNPHALPDESPVVADLADDLADTWRDLKRGLSLFEEGHVSAAVWEWRQSFWQHWGHHAAGGIYATHSWLANQAQGAT